MIAKATKTLVAGMIVVAALFAVKVASAQQCCGDCNGDGWVTIEEIITAVNLALNMCPVPRSRFIDEANGTITDTQTGLQWEKKVTFDQTLDLANLHDADNLYPWAGSCSVTGKLCHPTGAAATACAAGVEGDSTGCVQCTDVEGTCDAPETVWTWLVALNTTKFGTLGDWRLPKRSELESIIDLMASFPAINVAFHGMSCGTQCTDVTIAACACTTGAYWSATTVQPNPADAWLVMFTDGQVLVESKAQALSEFNVSFYVRAVRDGL